MRKHILTITAIAGCAVLLFAQQNIFINHLNNVKDGIDVDKVSEITFSADESTMTVKGTDSKSTDFEVNDVQDITFEDADKVVNIVYNGTDAVVTNPYSTEGVSIAKNGADVVVTSTTSAEIEYVLSGTTTDGCFKMYNAKKYKLTLNGVSITNLDGPAINVQGDKKTTVTLADGTVNTLADGATYTKVTGEDQKGTMFSEGKFSFQGNGTLNVSGKNKHAIACDDEIEVLSGNINVTSAASDAIHSKDAFNMSGGYLKLAASGDGIDGDDGIVNIKGGTIEITSAEATTKGIKSTGDVTISGGSIVINHSGGVVVTDGDPSYSTAIKSNGSINISGGDIKATLTGAAGKGISADGNVQITGGNVYVKTTGNGAKYTTASNTYDSYSATCIKADSCINVLGGVLTLESTGTAGKCMSADIDFTIGDGTSQPEITAKTSGAKFLVSGSGNNADYANPKVLKAANNFTINSGNIKCTSTVDGGEGIEAKNTLTINDGIIEVNTVDDGLNAAKNITVNGGKIYSYSSGNDGIDSNGTFSFNGGIIISSGTNSPEEGFDCDQNNFAIKGGVLIGTGGSTSTPTANSCTQCTLLYGASNATSGSILRIEDASGNELVTYKMPRSYNQYTFLFSSKDMKTNSTYTIKTGGTVTGGTEFHGYVVGGTYSGGSSQTTFTPTSMVTTVGNVSSGPGGGGGPGGGPGGGGRPGGH